MPKLKVTYEIEGTAYDRPGVGKSIVTGNQSYRLPDNATVEEVIPAFQPGFYRKLISEAKGYAYFWLTNNSGEGYVDVYVLNTAEPEFGYDATKSWSSIHKLYQRVWFQPVDDLK